MIYVYPKLSKHDLNCVRLGGAGLGNLLVIYSKALILASENNYKMIWPTWRSIKVGPYIRKEKDKRWYGDLFDNNCGCVDGFSKFFINSFHRQIPMGKVPKDGDVIVVDKYDMSFTEFVPYRELILDNIVKN